VNTSVKQEYAVSMESTSAGELVKVANASSELAGIVFDTPSRSKVVVAVMDAARGPIFRTVPLSTLTERLTEAPEDRALHLLIRRTPPPARGTANGGTDVRRDRPGHTRGAMHRSTGK
jgi:hypothetical protein